MLKAIVKDEPLSPMPRENLTIFVSIGAHSDLNFSGKPFTQERHFVALRLAVRATFRRAPISACQNRRAFLLSRQPLRDPQDHGSLARTANRKISHADHSS